MKLEVISRPASGPNRQPPLLLIHGAWHGAWCWKDTFLDWFAGNGWEGHAAVLGAENDAMFSVAEVQATARAYGVEAKIFPDMAHVMACEPRWEDVAEWIANWVYGLRAA